MRVMTDTKRVEIIRAAWNIFRNKGYSGATMAEVARELGGSKETLYRYFRSKEGLLVAAIDDVLSERADSVMSELSRPVSLRERLLSFAKSYMEFRLSSDMIAVERMMLAENDLSVVLTAVHEDRIRARWADVAEVFALEIAAGNLRDSDRMRAAIHFKSLIEGDLVERALFRCAPRTDEAIDEELFFSVDAFMRAYGVAQNSTS